MDNAINVMQLFREKTRILNKDDAAPTARRPQYIYVYIGDLPAAGACAPLITLFNLSLLSFESINK
jgi:hypothetical protein